MSSNKQDHVFCRNCSNIVNARYNGYDCHRCTGLGIYINLDMDTWCEHFDDLYDL